MKKLTSEQWHEIADLYEQAGAMVENMAETHCAVSAKYASSRLFKMAIRATGIAVSLEKTETTPQAEKREGGL